jgi:hypothetical protein
MPPAQTIELLEKVIGLSTREVERVLAREQTIPVVRPDFLKPSGPQTTRVSFDADPEFMAMFERLKNLQGNPGLSMCERLKAALKTEVERKENFKQRLRPIAKKAPKPDVTGSEVTGPDVTEVDLTKVDVTGSDVTEVDVKAQVVRAPEVNSGITAEPTPEAKHGDSARFVSIQMRKPASQKPITRRRFIPVSVRRAIAERSGRRCEFVDPVSGTRCESRFGLEFDHFPKPFAQGGDSGVTNLRHVCSTHNKLAAIRSFGRAKMREYFR